jgi:hypothetical protein
MVPLAQAVRELYCFIDATTAAVTTDVPMS